MISFKRNSFKLPKNKTFNYTPRHYKGKETGNPYDFDSLINKDRETVNYNDFRSHWGEARANSRHRSNRNFNMRMLVIVLVLVVIVMYVLDFDLSIFSKK